jgi:hypothetical protein
MDSWALTGAGLSFLLRGFRSELTDAATLYADIFPFESLPEEIQVSVFSFLHIEDLCSAALVSRNWRRLSSTPKNTHKFTFLSCHLGDDSLWIEVCRNRWHDKQNMMLDKAREKVNFIAALYV